MHIINLILNVTTVVLLSLAVLLTLWTTVRSASIWVKLVALEVLVNIFICGVGIWAVTRDFPALLDICIALSLIMFLSTVAYCQFLSNRSTPDV